MILGTVPANPAVTSLPGVAASVDLFPGLLASYRRRAGLTQSQLAVRVGVTASQVSMWERGINRPRDSRRSRAVEKALGLHPGEIGQYLGHHPPTGTVTAEAAIQADPDLSDDMKEVLLAALTAARRQER